MRTLELLGSGLVWAWLALPLLAWATRASAAREPASAHRNLLAALLLSAACLALPWLRELSPTTLGPLSPLQLHVQVLATMTRSDVAGLPAGRGFVLSPFGLLAGVWSLAFAGVCARWAVATLRLRRLLARSASAPETLRRVLDEQARETRVCAPTLLLSAEARGPFTVGVFAPVIVLPTALALQLSSERLELVLRHELAHVRRRDPATHLAARACAALFVLHPVLPRLLRQLALAREAAVDAEVARRDRHTYAHLLVEIAASTRFGDEYAHVSMDDTALTRRIAMLMEPTPRPRASFSTLILAALAVAGAALLAPRVLAEGPGQGVFIQRRLGGADDPLAPHQAEIRACYDQARQETPDLVVDTVAEFSLDGDWKVISASVPTPASPIFQRCMEQKALGWTFPPPAHLPPPPKDLPRDAKRLLALRVELRP